MWIQRPSERRLVSLAWLFLAVLFGLALSVPARADGGQGTLAEYRERFRLGMRRYYAGAPAEAIGIWEPIYRELGREKGYRLAYNLGIAYSQLGNDAAAAEHLRSFVDEVDSQRAKGETLDSTVTKEEADARQRLANLVARTTQPPTETTSPNRAASETKTAEGSTKATPEGTPSTASAPAAAAPTVAPQPTRSNTTLAPSTTTAGERSLRFRATETERKVVHPFSPLLIAVGGGLTLGSTASAIVLESEAISLRAQLVSEQASSRTISSSDRQRFDRERTLAYTATGAAIGFGAVTAGLALWYFLEDARPETPPLHSASGPGEARLQPLFVVDRAFAGVGVGASF